MNGRALNEKAVEVSPSSSRVLDRAAEILTPFPPSKNRPRPGDWTCPSCGFSNFQRRTACFRCSYPAVSSGPGGDPMGYSSYSYSGPHMMAPHQHMGHHGGHGIGHGRGMGGGGGMVPFRAGDWKCGSEGCGYHNFAKNVTCLRCGASRAGAAVVADSSFNSSMEPPSAYGIGPPSMGGAPGPGPFAPPASSYGSGAFGASNYGGHASNFSIPSAIGGPGTPWQPMGNTAYSQVSGSHSTGPFDSRTAEAAFSSAGNPTPATSISNGASFGTGYGGMDGGHDPFAFLSSGLGNLSMNEDARRNGANTNRSPA